MPSAAIIKELTGLPVAAGGMLSGATESNRILEDGKADMIYLGRELLRNPYWMLSAAMELNVDLEWPKQYERAKPR